MNGYEQHSLAFMAEARKMRRMPEAATTKPSRPRDAVNGNVAEAISADDLAMLMQYFQPRDKHDVGNGMDSGDWGDWGDWGDMCEAPLNAKKRNALSKTQFAIPEDRAYPINDIAHARNALSRVAQFGSPEEQRRVQRAVYAKFPELNPEKKKPRR
jgi:hypothetical protein